MNQQLDQAQSSGHTITLVLLQPDLVMKNRGIISNLRTNYALPIVAFGSTRSAADEWQADDWMPGPSPGESWRRFNKGLGATKLLEFSDSGVC